MTGRRGTRLLQWAVIVGILGAGDSGRAAWALDPEKGVTDYVVKQWTEEQGLPHRLVWSVYQSSDGYLWVGTQSGLVRFDGSRFATFNSLNEGAFTENSVRATLESPDGTLWIAPTSAQLIARRRDGFAVAEGLLKDAWLTMGARHFLADTKGTIWMTNGGGIASLAPDGSFQSLVPPTVYTGTNRRTITQDAQGRVWFSAPDGVYCVVGGQVTHPIQATSTRGIHADRDGNLWVGIDRRGLFRYREGSLAPVTLPAEMPVTSIEINDIHGDRDGNLWVGANNGLARLRRDGSGATVVPALADVSVQDMVEDSRGALWLATRSGLYELIDPAFRSFAVKSGIQDVLSLVERRDGTIWFVSHEQPFLQRVSKGKLSAFEGRLPAGPECVYEDRSGRLWLGTEQGLFHLEGQQWVRHPASPPGRITVVYEDPAGQMWLATATGGVFRMAGAESAAVASLGKWVERLLTTRDGTLWIATRDGVFRLQGSRPAEVPIGDTLARRYTRGLDEDADGALWLGTRDGLVRWKDGKVVRLSIRQGIPDPVVNGSVDDLMGNVWVGCSRGVFRLAKTEVTEFEAGKRTSVNAVLFGSGDGIRAAQASGHTALRASDGSLWFSTTMGAARIPHERLALTPSAPPVYIETAVIDGKSFPTDETAVVPPGERRMVFRFAAPTFDSPERVRFQYKLDGVDSDWRDSDGQREAIYTRVGPGPHSFHVKACNAAGVWNDTGASMTLELRPFFRETWWFIAAVVTAVGLVLFVTYRWRVREHEERQRELAQKVEERTADLQGEITERRKAEEEAGRERDLLHALMDHIPDLIFFKDADGRYTRVNEAHAEALGLADAQDAIGKGDADFFPKEFAEAARSDERALVASGDPLVGKAEHEPKSGRWYLVTKVPLRDRSGTVAGLVGISKDITERKTAEEKLERDLRGFLEVVSEIAHGDLTRRVDEGDDTLGRIARSVNEMLDSFATILVEARDAAFCVSTSSAEILAAATQIANGAQYGSDGVHSTSSSVEELAASMSQVSRHAEQSADSAKQVLEHVRESEQSVDATVLGMTRIDTAVTETAEKMRILEKRSEEIVEIIELIEEIASQSNLLSLNAAIEAAHAGDAGRGFSVVADEIRRLAERSTDATKSVSTIIKGIVGETRAVLAAMENAMREVKGGWQLSERAQAGLQEIQSLVARSSSLTEDILRASREQVDATRTVAQTMQGIANVTLESSAGATETTKAVKDLVDLSDQLNRAISRFKIDRADSAQGPMATSNP